MNPKTSGRLKVRFTLVTPAYSGGAGDASVCDGLRPPALKSALRFWWRTMHGGLTPRDLLAAEEMIFGSHDQSIGRRFRMRPIAPFQAPQHDRAGTVEASDVHAYLAYGPVIRDGALRANVLTQTRMNAGSSAEFELQLHDAARLTELAKGMWLLTLFGGYGSRSRRGWGGLSVEGVNWAEFGLPELEGATKRELLERIGEGLRVCVGTRASSPSTRPSFAAFSTDARISIGEPHDKPESALKTIYDRYFWFRRALGARYGHKHGHVGPDHALRSSWLTKPPAPGAVAPRGAALGLPLNARFSNKAQVNVGVGDDLKGRLASPVFFKVLKATVAGRGQFLPCALYLPSTCPEELWADVNGHKAGPLGPPPSQAVTEFFDGPPSGTSLIDYVPPNNRPWTGLGWTEVWK